MLAQRWKDTSIITKAWRHLSWTFEEAPRLAARAAREHLNGTFFDETEMEQEGPPEETDLILHDDDDDDAEDPESTGTAVAEAVVPIVLTQMRDRMCARIVPLLRT